MDKIKGVLEETLIKNTAAVSMVSLQFHVEMQYYFYFWFVTLQLPHGQSPPCNPLTTTQGTAPPLLVPSSPLSGRCRRASAAALWHLGFPKQPEKERAQLPLVVERQLSTLLHATSRPPQQRSQALSHPRSLKGDKLDCSCPSGWVGFLNSFPLANLSTYNNNRPMKRFVEVPETNQK